jgi:uncharacterized repeat protein (TIGR01451 family)
MQILLLGLLMPGWAMAALTVSDLTAPNIVGDSNVGSTLQGPQAFTIGSKFCNTGTTALNNVFAYIGDGTTPGTFVGTICPAGGGAPQTSCGSGGSLYTSPAGGLKLAMTDTDASDATRYVGSLAAGACKTVYWQVKYPTLGANSVPVWGKGSGPGNELDDLRLNFTTWGTALDNTNATLSATLSEFVIVRNEISASANKLLPQGGTVTTSPASGSVGPGEVITVTFSNVDFGSLGAGFDVLNNTTGANTASGDGIADNDFWFQPIGEADMGGTTSSNTANWDPHKFRLSKVKVRLRANGGGNCPNVRVPTTNKIPSVPDPLDPDGDGWIEDKWHFYNMTNTYGDCSWTGDYSYTLIALGTTGNVTLSPYQEAASGSDNEKYNGDYCGDNPGNNTTLCKVLTSAGTGNPTLAKAVDKASAVSGSNLSYTLTYGNTSANIVGQPDSGLPVSIRDAIPANTTYVAGSANCPAPASPPVVGATAPYCTLFYSTNNGSTWTLTEPSAASVTNLRWDLTYPIPASVGTSYGTVGFQVTTSAVYSGSTCNIGQVEIADGSVLNQSQVCTTLGTGAALGDKAWVDSNGNGIQDGGETGLNGVTVNLRKASDNSLVGTATTAGGGLYSFSGLAPDTYYVEFVAPGGYSFTGADQGGDDAADSDANATTGKTGTYTLSAGETISTVDAGLYQPVTLGDFVWSDHNGDGMQGGPEDHGLNDITVELWNSTATTLLQTTVTNASGLYSFTAPPGTYRVKFIQPSPTVLFTTADAGGDDALDSDANATTGLTGTYTLTSGQSNDTIDAAFYEVGTIGDFVWVDSNANGIQDTGETGLSGVTVQLLDSTGNSVLQTSATDANGLYNFTVTPGTYRVRFLLPGGYQFSLADQGGDDTQDSDADIGTGMTSTVAVSTNGHVTTLDAGIYETASVGDFVWKDSNANGVQDGGETGLDGVTVTLYTSTGIQIGLPQITGTDGAYSFTGLTPGSYKVCFTSLPSGYLYSPTGAGTSATDSDANTGSPAGCSTAFTLTSGQTKTDIDAGLYKNASIGDFVWVDTDGDGVQDGGESGLENVTVTLYTSGDVQVGSPASTSGLGAYSFANLTPGDYKVCFTKPSGYQFSPTGAGTTATDSNADTTTGCSAVFTLNSGDANTTLDAGLYQPVSIGDFVWVDTDGDGVQDPTETTGLAGATVTLYTSTGTQVGTPQTTTGTGLYSFTGLAPGSYKVCFTAPGGYSFGPASQGGDPAKDSDANAGTPAGCSAVSTLTSGQSNNDIDAGLYQPVTLGNFVWSDHNGDGVQGGPQDHGLNDITVQLLDATGTTVLQTTQTDADGFYSFTAAPGTYTVKFVKPNATIQFTTANTGDDTLDSDANTTTGLTGTYTLTSGQTNNTIDAAFFDVAIIGDKVWVDSNANGIQDPGEPGLDGATVKLFDSTGTTELESIVTHDGGTYEFTVNPGTYKVKFILPGGYSFSAADQGGDESKDSDADTGTGFTATYTVGSNEHLLTVDAGAYQTASVGNLAWIDSNGNGVQDPTETSGLAGVTVTLYTSTGTQVSTPQTTPGTGLYSFTGLTPGSYKVCFTAPDSYIFGPASQGGDSAKDSDANAGTPAGCSAVFTLTSGQTNNDIDAGLYQSASVGNFVWVDADADGRQDDFETTGLAGVTVTLYTSTGTQVGTPQTTPGTGLYSFTGLTPGSYKVCFAAPSGYSFGPTGAGTLATDSDANAGSPAGCSAVFSLAGGDSNDTIDAGLYQNVSLGNFVWDDTNGNGIQDGGETGLAGVTVTLYDHLGELVGSPQTTTGTGAYSFSNLVPDSYKVCFTALPTGYLYSPTGAGTTATDSDAGTGTGTGCSAFVALYSGDSNDTLDAGLYHPELKIIKTVSNAQPPLGKPFAYTLQVVNLSGLTTDPVQVKDYIPAGITVTAVTPATQWSCAPAAPLAGTATLTCDRSGAMSAGATETITLTAVATATGSATNTATVTGDGDTPPGTPDSGNCAAGVEQNCDRVAVNPTTPGIDLVKKVSLVGTDETGTANGQAGAGEKLTYTFIITNKGDVNLTPVSLVDPQLNSGSLTCDATTAPFGNAFSLAGVNNLLRPNEKVTCYGKHTVTAAEAAAGHIVNTATATGKAPDGTPVQSTGTGIWDNTPPASPVPLQGRISLIKTAAHGDTNGNGAFDLDEPVSYGFIVTNVGSTALSNIAVTDPLLAGAGANIDCGGVTTLAVGAQMTCTVSPGYTLKSADVTAGQLVNTATVTATDPNSNPVADTDTHVLNSGEPAALELEKTAVLVPGLTEGDTINYKLVATNTGGVPINNVTLSDNLGVIGGCTPVLGSNLNPGQQIVCNATYTVQDGDTNPLSNLASASGTPPGRSTPVYASANHVVPYVEIVPPSLYTIGNQVWWDGNNNGLYEPASNETGIAGITLRLLRCDASGANCSQAKQQDGQTLIPDQLTGSNGTYQFGSVPVNTAAQSYVVQVLPSNFTSDATGTRPLYGASSSTDPAGMPNWTDGRDQGIGITASGTSGILSRAINLTTLGDTASDFVSGDFGFVRKAASSAPDVYVNNVANVSTVNRGTSGALIYTLTAGTTADGGNLTRLVVVQNTLPTGMTAILPITSSGWNCAASTTLKVSCTYSGSFPVAANSTVGSPIAVRVNVASGMATGSVPSTATITKLTGESSYTNNTAAAAVTVQ